MMKKTLSLFCLLISFQQATAQITWSSPPTTISASGVNSTNAVVGMASNGTGMAIWIQNNSLKAATIPAGGSWSATTTLSSVGATATAAQLVMAPNGNASAIWLEGTALKTKAYASGSWGSATTLAASGASSPAIGIDSSGDVVAVWVAAGAVKSSTKAAGGSWQALADTLAVSGTNPQVAIGANKTVFAVWHATNPISSMDAIYGISKTIGGLWGVATTISNPNQNCNYPQIVVDSNGTATCAWFMFNLTGVQYTDVIAQASQFSSSGSTWTTPVSLSAAGIVNPANLILELGVSTTGAIQAIWTNSFDGLYFTLESAVSFTYDNWSGVFDLTTDPLTFSADSGVSNDGTVYVAFPQTDGTTFLSSMQTNVSSIGGAVTNSWSGLGAASNGSNNAYPKIVVAENGSSTRNGLLVWQSYDGSNVVIQAVTGSETMIQPITNLSVSQSANNYGVFTTYSNILNWTPSISSEINQYLIYRNNILVAQLPSTQTQFADLNQSLNGTTSYGVSAVANDNEQSPITYVNFP